MDLITVQQTTAFRNSLSLALSLSTACNFSEVYVRA